MNKVLIALILVFSSSWAMAVGRLHLNGEKIVSIKILADGGFQGTFSSAHSDPDGCGGSKNTFLVLPDHAAKDALLSVVLAAKMSDSKITVYAVGCDANGPIVNTLDVL